MIPQDPEELDLLAGEYVLGTLEAWQAREVEAALATTAPLRVAVARWEARLVGLAEIAPPEPPLPALWSRIEEQIRLAELPRMSPAEQRKHRGRLLGNLAFWRWSTVGLAAATAALAFLLLAPRPQERFVAVLQTDRAAPAGVVEGQGGGGSILTSLNPRPPEPNRSLELWALPPSATAPTSLGVIPPEGRVAIPPGRVTPQAGLMILISLEPQGGSPTGLPTGPVLFTGQLVPAPEPTVPPRP
jgi:anti-sigma-K factor RskA